MRRNLATVLAMWSLLWGASGAGVLALAAHEHFHHTETHHHEDAFQTALHGHAHEGTPAHDHEIATTLGTSRAPAAAQTPALSPENGFLTGQDTDAARNAAAWVARNREHGPPPYLMHCVILT